MNILPLGGGGGGGGIQYLQNVVNYVFKWKRVPASQREGLVTPIFKKGDKTDPANYRGITVTTVVLKVIDRDDKSQSDLQKGFTAEHFSIDAALILSECYSCLFVVFRYPIMHDYARSPGPSLLAYVTCTKLSRTVLGFWPELSSIYIPDIHSF